MITAKEARRTSDLAQAEKTKAQLKVIENLIIKATSEGKTEIFVYDWLQPHTVNELKDLGYKIEDNSNQKDGELWKILW